MFQNAIKNGFRKTLIQISNNKTINLDKADLLKQYLDETQETNTILSKYQYNEHTLFKDCFNNLYYKINNTDNIELIGYIDDNNKIIFDKLVKKTFEPKKKGKKKTTQSSLSTKKE